MRACTHKCGMREKTLHMNDVSSFDYLRKRPFLVITLLITPAAGVRTEHRGWAKEPDNLSIQESPTVVFRISERLLRQAEVIIDLRNNKVIKNRLRHAKEPVADETILRRCKEHYHDKIQAYV